MSFRPSSSRFSKPGLGKRSFASAPVSARLRSPRVVAQQQSRRTLALRAFVKSSFASVSLGYPLRRSLASLTRRTVASGVPLPHRFSAVLDALWGRRFGILAAATAGLAYFMEGPASGLPLLGMFWSGGADLRGLFDQRLQTPVAWLLEVNTRPGSVGQAPEFRQLRLQYGERRQQAQRSLELQDILNFLTEQTGLTFSTSFNDLNRAARFSAEIGAHAEEAILYREAAEKAAWKKAELLVQVGDAWMKAGKADKASSAYQEAVLAAAQLPAALFSFDQLTMLSARQADALAQQLDPAKSGEALAQVYRAALRALESLDSIGMAHLHDYIGVASHVDMIARPFRDLAKYRLMQKLAQLELALGNLAEAQRDYMKIIAELNVKVISSPAWTEGAAMLQEVSIYHRWLVRLVTTSRNHTTILEFLSGSGQSAADIRAAYEILALDQLKENPDQSRQYLEQALVAQIKAENFAEAAQLALQLYQVTVARPGVNGNDRVYLRLAEIFYAEAQNLEQATWVANRLAWGLFYEGSTPYTTQVIEKLAAARLLRQQGILNYAVKLYEQIRKEYPSGLGELNLQLEILRTLIDYGMWDLANQWAQESLRAVAPGAASESVLAFCTQLGQAYADQGASQYEAHYLDLARQARSSR